MTYYHAFVNSNVPNGNYVAQFIRGFKFADGVVADFLITTGPLAGSPVKHVITSRRAKKEVPIGGAGIIEWLAYCGDSKASSIYDAILNHVDNKLIVQMEGGFVKAVKSATHSERTYNSFMRMLSVEWTVSSSQEAQRDNLNSCKAFYNQTGHLPRLSWPEILPNEKKLRRWLNAAINPDAVTYFHDASLWVNNIFQPLARSCNYNAMQEWPLLLLNKGFESPPPQPRAIVAPALPAPPRIPLPSTQSAAPKNTTSEMAKETIGRAPIVPAVVETEKPTVPGRLRAAVRVWFGLRG